MNKRNFSWLLPATVALACWSGAAVAADHAESPQVTADPAADIADVFIFRSPTDASRLVAAMTFAGRPCTAPGGVCGSNANNPVVAGVSSNPTGPVGGVGRIDAPLMRCDRNVLYVFNFAIGTGALPADGSAPVQVFARLARNGDEQCGLRIENVPGAGGRALVGREGAIIQDSGGLRAFAGLVEDSFVFDTPGFVQTLNSLNPADGAPGTIGFSNTRDGFGGRNLSAIVFEIDQQALTVGEPIVRFWGETFRFPGTTP